MNAIAVFIGAWAWECIALSIRTPRVEIGMDDPLGTLLANTLATAILLGVLSHQSSIGSIDKVGRRIHASSDHRILRWLFHLFSIQC